MNYIYNDGGRAASGRKGIAGDCGVRALAIASGMDYSAAYKLLAETNKQFGFAKSARNGLHKEVYSHALESLGYKWHSAPKFQGRKARASDLTGTVIARMAGHFAAIIDGKPHDIFDSSHKMVYGYWSK